MSHLYQDLSSWKNLLNFISYHKIFLTISAVYSCVIVINSYISFEFIVAVKLKKFETNALCWLTDYDRELVSFHFHFHIVFCWYPTLSYPNVFDIAVILLGIIV